MPEQAQLKLAGLIPLLLLALICSVLLITANSLTRDRIEANRQAVQLRLITEVMYLPYDNDLLSDRITVTDSGFFKSGLPIDVYRARNNGRPAGLVFMPVRATGYNGLIDLAVGINYNGELTGVRLHNHQETEGLGDQVHQDRSEWILGFDGRSLANTVPDAWNVVGDGGEFDQLSGATITPRGVIRAVKSTLDYYDIHRDELYR